MSEYSVVFIDRDHGLGEGDLHDVHTPAGDMDGEESHARPQTGACRKHRGAHLAIAACHQQGMAIGALMAVGCPIDKERRKLRFVHKNHTF